MKITKLRPSAIPYPHLLLQFEFYQAIGIKVESVTQWILDAT